MKFKRWKDIKKGNRRRIIVYGSLVLGLWGFYVYQPWELDIIPRELPKNNPAVDPDTATLFSPRARIVVVTAHPDDSEFYLGGPLLKLAAAGAEMYQIVITDGDKAYYPFEDHEQNRKVRRAEQLEASKQWKVKQIVFLSYPDGRLRVNDDVRSDLKRHLLKIQPNYVFSFDRDYPPRFSHQDHRRAGDAVVDIIGQIPSAKWLMLYSTQAPNYIFDTSKEHQGHMELLAVHKSQFYGERLQRIRNMISEDASNKGDSIGKTFGIGVRAIAVNR